MAQDSTAVPVANRPETILGSTIGLQVLTAFALALRVFARSRQAGGFGLDDLFVSLAAASSLAGSMFVMMQYRNGLGKHQSELEWSSFERYLIFTYASICSYAASTALIKISILFQYIRVAGQKHPLFQRTCYFLIGIVAVWGIIMFFIIAFGCTPVWGYWNVLRAGSKCFFFGSKDYQTKVGAHIVHASMNMVLDIVVFCLPIFLLKNARDMSRRSRWGLFGVFSMGGLVVIISILRLESIITQNFGLLRPHVDVTFYTPSTVLWTCSEINIAMITASLPIFWKTVTALAFGRIWVTNEVEVRSDDLHCGNAIGAGIRCDGDGATNSSRRSFSRLGSGSEREEDEQELTPVAVWGKSYANVQTDGKEVRKKEKGK